MDVESSVAAQNLVLEAKACPFRGRRAGKLRKRAGDGGANFDLQPMSVCQVGDRISRQQRTIAKPSSPMRAAISTSEG